jgi:hypothetical protein
MTFSHFYKANVENYYTKANIYCGVNVLVCVTQYGGCDIDTSLQVQRPDVSKIKCLLCGVNVLVWGCDTVL